MNENEIRDILASDLSIIEDGLKLHDTEQYIPSAMGTKSFIDILAKDKFGHWVIIEVKKTNAAAREAVHEVFKYIESLQRHFGARNDEIRAIVAAVEWKELLIPFSLLKNETNVAVDGVRLVIETTSRRIEAHAIEPVAINQGRYLAPWHELNLYHDKPGLNRGIASYDASCQSKKIEDYVMVVMKAADDFNERAQLGFEYALQGIFSSSGNETPMGIPILPRYEYILYFAPQILSHEFCYAVLQQDAALYEDVCEYAEGMDTEEELCMLHENIYGMKPHPEHDSYEIGYAAKFAQRLLIDEGWTIECILRRGIFSRNSLLSDDAIIDELKGLTGSSNQAFERTISLSNKAHLVSAKEGLGEALMGNPAWLSQIKRVIDEASAAWPDASASIKVHAPSSGLFTLYFLARDNNTPFYDVAVTTPDGIMAVRYLGMLNPEGQPASLQQILDKYYDGQSWKLMFLASCGYYEARDVDVMEDLGLIYRTFRIDDPNETAEWAVLKDDRWRSFQPTTQAHPLQAYFDANYELITTIVKMIDSHMLPGGIWSA